MIKRIERVNQLIKKELSKIILREADFPNNVLVTLTRIDTSPNLIETKVFVSTMPESRAQETLDILNKNIYRIQQTLNKRLVMRPIPKIMFREEKEVRGAGRVEELLEQAKRDCKKTENV
ncbi:MAG: 30S ribosome-binding factor RbfA [Candidatus Nealsonbacteria bacterium]|nr:30S ribosome-binding factor RbfA [Candidatus Nealsonbacteria bacterium]